jgi:hypothetical protein
VLKPKLLSADHARSRIGLHLILIVQSISNLLRRYRMG